MARLKVRFELNKGRTGAPLSKLGKIAEQAERFLKALAAEVEIDQRSGEWLAINFKNGSVSYDAEFQGEVSPAAAEVFGKHLLFAVDFDPDSEGANGLVTDATMAEFAALGRIIDPDEVIGIGIYNGGTKPKWRRVGYGQTARIRQRLESPLPAYGSLQGIIHSLHKEAARPYFQLRELATDTLVRCFYSASQYDAVVNALRQKTAVLHVAGNINYDRRTRAAAELKVERLDEAKILAPRDFEALFGSMPKFTGAMTTDDYIDLMREDDR
ncbi:MAG: hypothetical protein U1E56_09140 [Bauldia sp.]